MPRREDQKKQREKVSQKLIRAALDLSAQEGYASLSLRSVAREAGIAPTSFYRHFRDMDELGVAMADKAKKSLFECLAEVRETIQTSPLRKDDSSQELMAEAHQLARPFVEGLLSCFQKHENLFRLFFQERTGASQKMRKSIGRDLDSLAKDFGSFLDDLKNRSLVFADPFLLARTMLLICAAFAMEVAGSEEPDWDNCADRAVSQLTVFLTGSLACS